MRDMNAIVGTHDIVLVTLDTLRYDVAKAACEEGRTPNLAALLPGGAWEKRHAPGNFTYASHHAIFAGFLPTPAEPGHHDRLLSLRFEGSTTTTSSTCVLDGPDIVSGLRARGYHAACIGGVGFFNKQNPLGSVFPGLFDESHWSAALGVTDPRSTENQVAIAREITARVDPTKRLFLFLNVSALHQPNWMYLEAEGERAARVRQARETGAKPTDSLASHAAALAYVDQSLPPLFDALRARGRTLFIVCSDHGTAYGDDGYEGHRLAHPVVWNVPYAEFILGAP